MSTSRSGAALNVVISSAGRRVGLLQAFRHALSTLGLEGSVSVVDLTSDAATFPLADSAWTVPRCTDDAFVPTMLELCSTHDLGLVVPTIDTELGVWAAHRQAFAEIGTSVVVSSPEVVAISADKQRTHEWLTEHGLPTVRQASPAEVLADITAWRFPLIAKPTAGSRSIGLVVAQNADDLARLPADVDYVVQTIAPGREYTVSVFADPSGVVRSAVPRLRLETRGG